jgi:hypothetical protein
MIRVQPVYKCLYCGATIEGVIRELSDRPKKQLIVDVGLLYVGLPTEPHYCGGFKGEHGVMQYVGFNHIGQD